MSNQAKLIIKLLQDPKVQKALTEDSRDFATSSFLTKIIDIDEAFDLLIDDPDIVYASCSDIAKKLKERKDPSIVTRVLNAHLKHTTDVKNVKLESFLRTLLNDLGEPKFFELNTILKLTELGIGFFKIAFKHPETPLEKKYELIQIAIDRLVSRKISGEAFYNLTRSVIEMISPEVLTSLAIKNVDLLATMIKNHEKRISYSTACESIDPVHKERIGVMIIQHNVATSATFLKEMHEIISGKTERERNRHCTEMDILFHPACDKELASIIYINLPEKNRQEAQRYIRRKELMTLAELKVLKENIQAVKGF